MKQCEVKVAQLCPALCNHMNYSPRNSPGQNTGVGSLSLLQGIFPTQGSNQGLPHHRWILYQLSYQGSPWNNVEVGIFGLGYNLRQSCLGEGPIYSFKLFLLFITFSFLFFLFTLRDIQIPPKQSDFQNTNARKGASSRMTKGIG